jgi:hypothetical protein
MFFFELSGILGVDPPEGLKKRTRHNFTEIKLLQFLLPNWLKQTNFLSREINQTFTDNSVSKGANLLCAGDEISKSLPL